VSSAVNSPSFSPIDVAAFNAAFDDLEPQPNRWATPGELARALDPTTRQTPALDLIDAALVDVAEGKLKRLIISMPPQEGKSERTTHYGALWMLHRNPNLRLGIVSYGDDIASQFSYKIRNDIVTFDGSEETVDLGMHLQKDSKAVSKFQLRYPAKGGVIAVGIGSSLTGRPIDALFIDDPVKDFRNADSMLLSEQAWQWWQSVARPRLHPDAPVVLILTRWHEADLAGRLLSKQADDERSELEHFDRWTVINIPAQADFKPELGQTDPLGRQPGEFMVSARGRTLAQWKATRAATSARIWNALYQGRPSPDSGDVWKRTWWRRFSVPIWSSKDGRTYRVDELDEMVMSWDMTFKDTRSSDFVVGQVWARRGADAYLIDQVRARLSFTDSLSAFEALVKKWPQASAKLIEDKANGTAIIDTLRARIPGLIAINPTESKYARANAVAPFIQSGNVHLPTGEAALFDVEALIEEAAGFPNAAHDDQVDVTSQALARLFVDGTGASAWTKAMKARVAAQLVGEAEKNAELVEAEKNLDPLEAARQAQFRQSQQ
jgi:predicted phage terminase large subunit-like protein